MTKPTELTTNEARAGRKKKGMRTVLVVSIIAAVVLMGAAFVAMN